MEDNNNNEMLCQPMIIYQPDEQLLLELSEFRKDNIAFRHYVIGLYRRVFE